MNTPIVEFPLSRLIPQTDWVQAVHAKAAKTDAVRQIVFTVLGRAVVFLCALLSCAAYAKTEKEIFASVKQNVVQVERFDQLGHRNAQGSGVVLGSALGSMFGFNVQTPEGERGCDILTNFHVIDRADMLVVRSFDGRTGLAQVLYFDRDIDIAVIRTTLGLVSSELPLAKQVEIGDRVLALGNPKGLGWTISPGIVSRMPKEDGHLVQTTAPISAGSSGGGLFDEEAHLIGVTTASVREAQNLNFAIWFRGELCEQVRASRLGTSWNPAGIWNEDWVVGQYRWDKEGPLAVKWEDTFRKGTRFARYIALKRKIEEKRQKWEIEERHLSGTKSLEAFWTLRDADMRPLRKALYLEFPNDEQEVTSYADAMASDEQKAAVLLEASAKWPSSLDVLQAVVDFFVERKEPEKVQSLLQAYRNLLVQPSDDVVLNDKPSQDYWNLYRDVTWQVNRREWAQRFNLWLDRLEEAGVPKAAELALPKNKDARKGTSTLIDRPLAK